MPLSGSQLRTQLADRNVHPIRTVAAPASGSQSPGLVVTLNIVFQGVPFKPEDIFDALEAKYGSGKVVSDTDTAQRLPLNLRVVP